jgi:4-amino-4-deoxy-L-arabinose transferase-like glycosyltransferase
MKAILLRLVLRVRQSPWLVTVLCVLATLVVIRPWGNYALNDDWTFALVAKGFAETGKIRLAAPSSPSSAGQAVLAALVIKVFGFSHVALRLLTVVVACAGLYAVDRLLALVTPRRSVRVMGLLLLAYNPIFFYSGTSFMTELHGWVPALFAAVLWFWDRKRLGQDATRIVSFWVAIGVGVLCGATFWTRQHCVLVFPALVAATVLGAAWRGRWVALLRSLPAFVVATAAFALVIYAYFPWARATGNYRPEFMERVGHVSSINVEAYRMQAGAAVVYLTAFFLPLLALVSFRARHRSWLHLAAIGFIAVALISKGYFETHAPSDFWIGPIWSHRVFPWVVNIVYNAGLGPITLDDVFFRDVAKPSWPRAVWSGIEVVLIAASALWAAVCAGLARVARRTMGFEILLFASALTVGSLVAVIQTHQTEVVDRYYISLILGSSILVPGVLATTLPSPIPGHKVARFAFLFSAVALFTIFGAHDQFRWNDARSKLVRAALAQGGTRATVQAGYEFNCWNRYSGLTEDELRCPGGCRCVQIGFCCTDDRFRIGMSVSPGYAQIAAIQPSYWLASGPPIVLSRRDY